jgi:hypothetical protein
MTCTDYTRRAIAAYYRTGGIDQPSSASGLRIVNGRHYVRLLNVNGLLAVYRVENSGRLKRLKRWPKELSQVERPAIARGTAADPQEAIDGAHRAFGLRR